MTSITDKKLQSGDPVMYCLSDQNDFIGRKGIIDRIENDRVFIVGLDVSVDIDVVNYNPPEPEPEILPLTKNWPLADVFSVESLKSLGYKVTKFDGQYGQAKEIKSHGKKTLQWNLDGMKTDYFGHPLAPNAALGVKDDCNTRTTFNGYVRNLDDLKTILELTR